ncbi:MAG: divalent-cation tolerance protein CutA [Vicinamibacterales bacterium]
MTLDACVVVQTTWPSENPEATTVARRLVEEGLAACVQLAPDGVSVYRWEGQTCESRERALTIKTTQGHVEALARRLAELHPYDVPELIVLPVVSGSEPYLRWVREAVAPVAGTDERP